MHCRSKQHSQDLDSLFTMSAQPIASVHVQLALPDGLCYSSVCPAVPTLPNWDKILLAVKQLVNSGVRGPHEKLNRLRGLPISVQQREFPNYCAKSVRKDKLPDAVY